MAHKYSKHNQSSLLLNLTGKLQFTLIIVHQWLSTVYVITEATQNQSSLLLNLTGKLQFILIIAHQRLSTVYVITAAAQFNPQNLGKGQRR